MGVKGKIKFKMMLIDKYIEHKYHTK